MAHVVETAFGRVRGAVEDARPVFRGVPFAEPPVGPLRFRPPLPPRPWRRVRDATRFGDVPLQAPDPISRAIGLARNEPASEDCLTLNVFTPALEGRRPVMVWIHGGGFASGSGVAPVYDGRRLSVRGDVVVVTFNYRVGALGFLYLGERSGEDRFDRCNWGLLDQVAALTWVRDHADRFGGDPENVTVFGESAGAGSIVALLAMPEARGLFRRAIVQSAAPDGVIDRDEAAWRAGLLRDQLAIAEGRTRLHELPADAWVKAGSEVAAARSYKTGMFFAPVIDGDVIPERPLDAIRYGAGRDVDLLIGTNRDELQMYRMGAAPAVMGDDVLRAALSAQLPGKAPDGRSTVDTVIEAYRQIRAARGQGTSGIELVLAIQTDLGIRQPVTRLAAWQANHRPATYMYLFDWESPMQNGELGACHALDLPFTFGTLDAPGVAEFAGSGGEAERLAHTMMDAWTSFARTGDPSHDALGPWPRYDAATRATMRLGRRCEVVNAPLEEERALLEKLLA